MNDIEKLREALMDNYGSSLKGYPIENRKKENIKILNDQTYGYKTLCNVSTGEYIRGFDVDFEPFMAEFPHLIDVGIMGSCAHGKSGLCLKAGIQCYQNALTRSDKNMSLANYTRILMEGGKYLHQIALGGAGDPDMHENFEEILAITRLFGVAPNFTTSGLGMTKEKAQICKKYCGAVAVSMYSRLEMQYVEVPKLSHDSKEILFTRCNEGNVKFISDHEYEIKGIIQNTGSITEHGNYKIYNEKNLKDNYTYNAINHLVSEGVKTNIHYVLSNETIDEALLRVKYNGFPQGINAVIFLLHKPVGLGEEKNVLKIDDPRVVDFFRLVDTIKLPYKLGFDSCSIPGVINICANIDWQSIDTCEGARYSMYIDSNMVAVPCSFDNQSKEYGVQLGNGRGIKDAWQSIEFENFRDKLKGSCSGCPKQEVCMGGCPLEPSVVLCNDK